VKGHTSEFGAWSEAARIALAMAPNPAGAERVFSLLKILLRSIQDTFLYDCIRGSITLRYSNIKRNFKAHK
jgi:hypothetical protein